MNVMILNSSGNVGKSFIAREVFYSNLKDCKIIELETMNTSSSNFDNIKNEDIIKTSADKIEEVYDNFFINENNIVDVGASNLESLIDVLSKYDENFLKVIDYFIIPVVPDSKQGEDSAKTLNFLYKLGIDKKKIKLIFNKHDLNHSFEENYVNFLYFVKKYNNININDHIKEKFVIEFSSAVEDLHRHKLMIREIVDGTDWILKARELKNKKASKEELMHCSAKHLISSRSSKLVSMTKHIIDTLVKNIPVIK